MRNTYNHARGLEDRRLAVHRAELVRVDIGEIDADVARLRHVQNGGVHHAEDNGDRQVEDDRRKHRDKELADAGLELMAEDIADALPVVHAPRRDHQHTRERRERQARHHAAEQEHRGKQEQRMKHARKARLLAGLDRYARACDGRGRGNTAKKRQQDVTNALRDQLLIGVERFALHARGRCAAKQALDHAERRNGHDGRDKIFKHRKAQAADRQAVGQQERFRNITDNGKAIHPKHRCRDRRKDDADERARHACAPLFRPEDHHQHDEKADEHRLHVRMEAKTAIGRDLFQIRAALRHRAEEVVDLPHRNDDGNARCEAHDDGHRDEADEPPELKNARKQQQDARGKAGEKYTLQAVFRDDADEHRAHRTRRARDLVRRAAENGDDHARDDGRDKPGRRARAG